MSTRGIGVIDVRPSVGRRAEQGHRQMRGDPDDHPADLLAAGLLRSVAPREAGWPA